MRPDMYGPFWLCTTLIFTMAAAGNLGALMSFVPTEEKQVCFACGGEEGGRGVAVRCFAR